MFTKASLVLIVALLVAILANQRSQQVVHAQGSIEYKAVRTNVSVGREGIAGTRDSGEVEEKIIEQVGDRAADAQAILCSDYLKGVLTLRVLKAVFEAGRQRKVPVIVAPKDKDLRKYDGASVLMPNVRELSRLVGTPMDGDGWLANSAAHLAERLRLEALLVTRGSAGMTLFERQEVGLRRVDIPTVARSVYEVTGAGDTALAALPQPLRPEQTGKRPRIWPTLLQLWWWGNPAQHPSLARKS